MVDSVSGTNSTSTQTAGSDIAKLSQDYTTFLKMLTTQLQNQDPLSPMDSAQFTQQLVAFSGVEQQIAANDKLKELLSLQKTSGTGALLNYIGKEVEAEGNELSMLKDFYSTFSYTLSDTASTATLTIKDAQGNVVRTTDVAKSIGRHEIVWDGKNDSGQALSSGIYTIEIDAKKADGSAVKTTTTTYNIADGVQTTDSGAVLTFNKLTLSVDNVLAVRAPLANSTNNPS